MRLQRSKPPSFFPFRASGRPSADFKPFGHTYVTRVEKSCVLPKFSRTLILFSSQFLGHDVFGSMLFGVILGMKINVPKLPEVPNSPLFLDLPRFKQTPPLIFPRALLSSPHSYPVVTLFPQRRPFLSLVPLPPTPDFLILFTSGTQDPLSPFSPSPKTSC